MFLWMFCTTGLGISFFLGFESNRILDFFDGFCLAILAVEYRVILFSIWNFFRLKVRGVEHWFSDLIEKIFF
jgi:hypothetical protein